jgi:hypothetical protein
LQALQANILFGLRVEAKEFMTGEFYRSSWAGVAAQADKVKFKL